MWGERGEQHSYQGFRNFSGGQLRNRQIIVHFTIANLVQRLAEVWCESGERKPEGSAQRIDVGTRIDRAAFKLLRTRATRCANKFPVSYVHLYLRTGDRLR